MNRPPRPGMHGHDSEADEWDEFYTGETGGAAVWSGLPNGSLVAEASDLAPGTAVDVGCGEGGDAIWLARRGWQVTALDPSRVALERARAAARQAAVEIRWVRSGLLEVPGGIGTYDLVSVQYPAIRRSRAVTTALLAAVAPGGTLLLVHHDLDGPGQGAGPSGAAHGPHPDHGDPGAHSHGAGPRCTPADYVMPDDVAVALDPGWVVEVHETRPRPGLRRPEAQHVRDIVLRARRLPTA